VYANFDVRVSAILNHAAWQ